jgi:hypothetical protein
MTFKDLQKLVQSQSGAPEQRSQLSQRLRDKPFWIWNQQEHKQEDIRTKGDCCFNHILGLPKKDGHDMPLLPYQRTLYDSLQNHKHVWIKKSRGIGVTEFLLRYIAWCCVSPKITGNSRVCIVTGPRLDLAEDLIARFKGLFTGMNFPSFDRTQSTVAIVNGVKVEAFPSHHVDIMRGLDNVKFILSDETDYYPQFQQTEVRAVMEGYIGKPNSDPIIVMVSTPKAPGGLMQQIELEPDSLYHKLFFDYTYGLQGPYPIYSQEQIDRARQSPAFEREYNLKYLGLIGNVFRTKDIDAAVERGKLYDPETPNTYTPKCMGIDPAYGSSSFGIVITQFVDGRVQILHAEEYKRPDFNEMLSRVWDLLVKHSVQKVLIDGANLAFIKSLKLQWGERPDYENEKKEYYKYMRVEPVSFGKEHKEMLGHCKLLLEQGYIAINPAFDKLITSLRTAVAEENILDKESTSYADIFDAYRLALKLYRFANRTTEQ